MEKLYIQNFDEPKNIRLTYHKILRDKTKLSGGKFWVEMVNRHCLMKVNNRFSCSSWNILIKTGVEKSFPYGGWKTAGQLLAQSIFIFKKGRRSGKATYVNISLKFISDDLSLPLTHFSANVPSLYLFKIFKNLQFSHILKADRNRT